MCCEISMYIDSFIDYQQTKFLALREKKRENDSIYRRLHKTALSNMIVQKK